MKYAFVAGGLGFIGSETVLSLIENGYCPVIADNLSNSKIRVHAVLEELSAQKIPFYEGDIRDTTFLDAIFASYPFEAILDFAAYKAVGESVQKPIEYYENNILGTLSLLKMMEKYKVKTFVFSSSATVYGDSKDLPYKETSPVMEATNPYGETKVMNERILHDFLKAHEGERYQVLCLRYFNPIGAHPSGLLGEDPNGIPNNLFPIINQVALGIRPSLTVYGNDYPTPDGTCIRDYLHVCDLAEGHVAGLKAIKGEGFHLYNLGTGKGTSVLEIIKAYEKVLGRPLPYQIGARRAGDIAVSYADPIKAEKELHWKAKRSIEDAAKDAYCFAQKVLKGE